MTASPPRRKDVPGRRGMTALGAQVARVAGPVLRKHGTAAFRLRAEWPRVVGEELAAVSMPEKLAGTVLHLRIESAAALTLQHRERQVIERINGYLGRDAVSRLRMVQGPVARAAASEPASRPVPAEDPELSARLELEIEDPALRKALLGLDRAMRGAGVGDGDGNS